MTENEIIILGAVFLAVLLFVFALSSVLRQRRDVERNLKSARNRQVQRDERLDELLGSGNEELRYYLDVVQNAGPNSVRMRLVQAGFFRESAVTHFNILRFIVSALVFVLAQLLIAQWLNDVNRAGITLLGLAAGGVAFVLCGVVLERRGNKRMIEFRKIFPDMMDLLLVCVDAGLSIEAAFDRITREFLKTVPDFGIHLSIVNLEIRAGRPLHEALHNLATRIRVEEARMLAVLFRQSEELGSSVSRTLRTFAKEMRSLRIIRAEEKANTLPIKMLFPMALCMFPVSLIIVLVPIMMTILELLITMSPS